MSITKLYAGVVGDPLNTSGPALATSVNNLIDTHVTHLKALPVVVNAQTDTVYNVVGFYSGTTKGGGRFVFDATASKSLHNGVTHYSPESLIVWDGTQGNLATLLNWTGTGSGCWVRVDVREITPKMCGANGLTNDSLSYQKAVNYCSSTNTKLVIDESARVENIAIAGNLTIDANGNTLRMVSSSTQRRLFVVSFGTLRLQNAVLNASDGSVGNVCLLVDGGAVEADNCTFTGAKLIGGYGEGVMVYTSALKSSFVRSKFYSNGGDGLTVYDSTGVMVSQCESYSNGGSGMMFNNQITPVGTKKIINVTVSDSNCYNNTSSGFGFGNPYNDHNTSGDAFGHTNKTCENVKVSNCTAYGNGIYGFGISCYGGRFSNISAYNNTFGGVLVNGRYIDIDNPVVTLNGSYGVDVGFGRDVNITGGEVSFNSVTQNAGGLLLEACLNVKVSGTKVFGNGPTTTGWNVIIAGVGGTGDGRYFPAVAAQITVECEVDCTDSRNGMRIDDAPTSIIDNNVYKGTDPLKYTRYALLGTEINNAKACGSREYFSTDPVTNVLTVPDIFHKINTNSASIINAVRPFSYEFFRSKIPFIRVTAQGSGYNPATTTVVITGDGSGATAAAFVSGGKVIGIRMTAFGSGYTTATATISGGGGTGATLTTQVGLPLCNSARTTICHNVASSFVMAGPPVINTPLAPTNLTAPNRGAITLVERYGQWIVESSNYGM